MKDTCTKEHKIRIRLSICRVLYKLLNRDAKRQKFSQAKGPKNRVLTQANSSVAEATQQIAGETHTFQKIGSLACTGCKNDIIDYQASL